MRLPGNDVLVCNHLGELQRDYADVKEFSVSPPDTGQGLVLYLKERAFLDEKSNLMRTYLVRLRRTNECVGYFSLKTGLVSVNEEDTKQGITFDTVPGIELANFAVNHTFTEKYHVRGLGYLLFSDLIAPFIKEHAKTLGIYMLYIFALPYPQLIKTYTNYGFKRLSPKDEEQLHLRIKPAYDESCIFMYQLLDEM